MTETRKYCALIGIVIIVLISYFFGGTHAIAGVILLSFSLFALSLVQSLYCKFKYKVVFWLTSIVSIYIGYITYLNLLVPSDFEEPVFLRAVMAIGIISLSIWIIIGFMAFLYSKRQQK